MYIDYIEIVHRIYVWLSRLINLAIMKFINTSIYQYISKDIYTRVAYKYMSLTYLHRLGIYCISIHSIIFRISMY